MKFRIIHNCKWMFWAHGMVVWPFVFFRYPKQGHVNRPSERLVRHEFEHCYQVKRMGVLKFYSRYIWLAMKHGYRNHPDEIAARAKEYDKLNPHEKHWYENGRVEL